MSRKHNFNSLVLLLLCASLFLAGQAFAQLPPEAVLLDKVKIPETIKSTDLCPVSLEASVESAPTWTHDGVAYRGHDANTQAEF